MAEPEPCSWCVGLEPDCVMCHPELLAAQKDWYTPEPGPEFQPVMNALGMTAPLLQSEWSEVKSEASRLEVAAQTAQANTVAHWRTLRQTSPLIDHEAAALRAKAHRSFLTPEAAPVASEPFQLSEQRLAEIKNNFRLLDVL